jgi:bud site selection protein 31
MPKITTSRTKKAPKGWDLIEPTLLELKQKLRDGKSQIIPEYSQTIFYHKL